MEGATSRFLFVFLTVLLESGAAVLSLGESHRRPPGLRTLAQSLPCPRARDLKLAEKGPPKGTPVEPGARNR